MVRFKRLIPACDGRACIKKHTCVHYRLESKFTKGTIESKGDACTSYLSIGTMPGNHFRSWEKDPNRVKLKDEKAKRPKPERHMLKVLKVP